MPTLNKLPLVLSAVIFFAATARAQDAAQPARTAAAPAITASATDGRVRVAAPDQSALRVELYSESGAAVFDSNFQPGSVFDFRPADANLPLPDGTHLLVVTTRDLQGRLRQRIGALAVDGNRLSLSPADEEKLNHAQAKALNDARAAQGIKPAGLAPPVVILDGAETQAVTLALHDGRAGQLTSTTGALTLRTGDVLKGEDAERVRVTEDGKVGIGTATPEATLDVAGTIRARGGIQFEDGSVLRSANGAGGGGGQGLVGGTGTPSRVAKWTDGSGTLGDSVIAESGGRVGIGTAAPTQSLHVIGKGLFQNSGSASLFIVDRVDGKIASLGAGGTSSTFAYDQSGIFKIESNSRSNISQGVFGVGATTRFTIDGAGNVGIGVGAPAQRLDVEGNVRVNGTGNGIIFPDGSKMVSAGANTVNAVQFVPAAEQLSVGDANGTAPMINLRGGSTCCSGPGGHTPAWFKVFQNGSFVATGNLGIGVSPMQGKGYRTSWDSYKGAFRSGYADNEWDDATVGFFSWAGGSNSTAEGLYAFAFGDTNFARSTSSIAFGSGNEVKGAAGFSAGAGNRVCDTYGVAFGNKAQSGGPLINGKCDPDTFNIRGLAAVAIGYNVTADQDHTTAMGKFATNNGFSGTFVWSDGSATASADTFRNTTNNEFAARATGGFRFRTNLGGTTGCNLPAGSGVFNCTSSRTTKENFTPVSGEDVLARLRKVPVSTWNYISEGGSARHLGPMAEDFYTAFGLGTSDKAIGIQDAVGVSIAAVKALDVRTAELQKRTAEVEQLRAQVQTLEQRLAALEQAVKAGGQK